MKVMTCPVNGARPISEFAYGGELRQVPDPAVATDAEWADYVFNRSGISGVKREWWCHTPSGVWFIAERDTSADTVLSSYLFGQGPGAGDSGQSGGVGGPGGESGDTGSREGVGRAGPSGEGAT